MVEDKKAALYEHFARVGKALGSPLRLVLLDVLAQGERSVEDLAATVGAKLANTSAQLHLLRAAGLVSTRRDGTRIWYALIDDDIGELIDSLRDVAARHLAEANRAAHDYLNEPAFVETMSPDELNRRVQDGTVIVVDVRPEAEYHAGHIPDARSIPLEQLEARLGELPGDTDIVAYCRGPYCVLAPQAARLLGRRGRHARTLTTGLPQWRRAGLPTQATPLPSASPARQTRPDPPAPE